MANYDVESHRDTERQTSLVQKNDFNFNFWHPTLVRPARKRLFGLKAKNGHGRFVPSALPHYEHTTSTTGAADAVVPIELYRTTPPWYSRELRRQSLTLLLLS